MLSRADSGHQELEILPVNLLETVRRVADEWRAVEDLRNLGFTETVTGSELQVAGDQSALQQLLNILLDNAVKYTPVPGRIHLSVEERGETAVVKVEDSGIGIAREDQAKIFERFYRADQARSRELGGAGLGLAIALWIVQQHHGSIWVESVLGQGSAFVVELPLQHAATTLLAS